MISLAKLNILDKSNIKFQNTKIKLLDTVLCGDILDVMKSLKKNGETYDCIYADPDYNVGIKYRNEDYSKSYNEYIEWCGQWSKLAYDLLDTKGNFFIINYPKNNAYLRVNYLDRIFYEVNEYVWVYNVNIGQSSRRFTTAHRTILHCKKSKDNNFYKDNVAVPYQNPKDRRIKANIRNGSKGRMPYSWFYFDLVKNVSKDKTFHPCQIPQNLSKLLISSSTKIGDNVLILFAGSGNDVLSAIELKRNVKAIEIDPEYCDLIRKRIKDTPFSLHLENIE